MVISDAPDLLVLARRALPLVLAATLSGCTFTTSDIRRPLVVDRIPEEVGALAALAEDGVGEKEILESLAFTRKDVELFQIKKYELGINLLGLQSAGKALSLFPKNPYAWIQLGASLALMNQMEAATTANQRGLALIANAGDEGVPELAPLRTVALLNLASFHLSMGNDEDAYDALQKMEPPPPSADPVHRLAYYWTSAQVLSALGEADEAREALQIVWETPAFELENTEREKRSSYPQFFEKTMRMGNFLYIEGLIA